MQMNFIYFGKPMIVFSKKKNDSSELKTKQQHSLKVALTFWILNNQKEKSKVVKWFLPVCVQSLLGWRGKNDVWSQKLFQNTKMWSHLQIVFTQ